MDLRESARIPPYVIILNMNNSLGNGIETDAEKYI